MNVEYNALVPSSGGFETSASRLRNLHGNQRNASLDFQVVEQYLVYMSIFWCVGSRDSESIFTTPQRLHDLVEKKMPDHDYSDWGPSGFAFCEI
jgi:hypothetical protein